MADDFEEMENLMDGDSALDYILYEDMNRGNNEKGWARLFGGGVLLVLPFAAVWGCLSGCI